MKFHPQLAHTRLLEHDTSRRAGKEVPETKQWRMAHYSEERKAMINEKADIL
ncbi:hypothetical protein CTI12_AA259620 [Artemisia annua]|uniref:Uncharacterized protein n=1 Tax=Artemisia annua TaxID=35608 RepID=A0A2U1NJG8_ARTAN|nr:hypothetical protein CTI12_AA259620 [Artemisia annua]